MHATFPQSRPMLDRSAARIPGDGDPEGYIDRGACDCALRSIIRHHLEVARSSIEDAIASCIRRESQGDQVETDDHWHFVPHHLTEIDSLVRMKHHLKVLLARFHAAIPLIEFRHASSPVDVVRADSLHRLDIALVNRAAALAGRFEASEVGHDLMAVLEADLYEFELLLDERALLFSRGERRQVRGSTDYTVTASRAGMTDMAEAQGTRPGCY